MLHVHLQNWANNTPRPFWIRQMVQGRLASLPLLSQSPSKSNPCSTLKSVSCSCSLVAGKTSWVGGTWTQLVKNRTSRFACLQLTFFMLSKSAVTLAKYDTSEQQYFNSNYLQQECSVMFMPPPQQGVWITLPFVSCIGGHKVITVNMYSFHTFQ